MKVFLSASIPLPNRNPVFLETVDAIAIREAIKALVFVLLERNGTMVFGGHPAITPLISMLLREAGVSPDDHIRLYQSKYFMENFPPEIEAFKRTVFVDAVANDRELSLDMMRRSMILEKDYTGAVFIGGMEGVIEEFKLFRELQPDVKLLPVASTGAASLQLYENYDINISELKSVLTYTTLFQKLLW